MREIIESIYWTFYRMEDEEMKGVTSNDKWSVLILNVPNLFLVLKNKRMPCKPQPGIYLSRSCNLNYLANISHLT